MFMRAPRISRYRATLGAITTGVTALVLCGATGASAATVERASQVSALAAPERPLLSRWVEPHSGELENSDGHVFIRIDPVPGEPGATVRLRYSGPQKNVTYTIAAGVSGVIAKVTGLTNGKQYTFTAVVCDAAKQCATSDPFAFVPYKAMDPATVRAGVSGRQVQFRWSSIRRNYSPLEVIECHVNIYAGPVDTLVSTVSADPDRSGSTSVAGVKGTTYSATHECYVRGVVSPLQGKSNAVTVR